MPNSYAEQTTITCPSCSRPFNFDVWLIIDTQERPDLLARIHANTLHRVMCPYCRRSVAKVNTPLLLYRPNETPVLLFLRAQQATRQQNERQVHNLIGHLRSSLGTAWQDEWIADGVSSVSHSFLPDALNDFEHALKKSEAVASQNAANTSELRSVVNELTQLSDGPQDMLRRVELCRRALDLLPCERNLQTWAKLHNQLAISLIQTHQGDRAENLEQAIYHLHEVMKVWTREKKPIEWAQTMHNLATAYIHRIQGDRAENLERAIQSFQQALTVLTRETVPLEWTQTMNNLATIYADRIHGDREENLEQALHLVEEVLEIATQAAMPAMWAQTMSNMADIYHRRIRGNRAANIEQAIVCCQQALEVRTPKEMPTKWAITTSKLAYAFAERIEGDRAENLEVAIRYYQQALTVMTPQTMPIEWARTTNNLATAYTERLKGRRAENVEKAITACRHVMMYVTRVAFPFEWAATQNNLANAYMGRIEGKRGDNIEQAIAFCHQALEVRTRQAMPQEWAITQRILANAYADRIHGDKAESLEQAIHHYEHALEVFTPVAFPIEWAMTMNNLANAYHHRIRGERVENIETAVFYFQEALKVMTREAMPVVWARTMNNLGTVFSDRLRGDRAGNLENAIHYFQLALTVYTDEVFPFDWAMVQINLANAYGDRIEGNRAENLEKGIFHCQQALEVYTLEAAPERWATTQVNLATLFSDRLYGDRAENCEAAIHHYQQALVVFTNTAFPIKWARTMANLGAVYSSLVQDDNLESFQQALFHYQKALTVLTRDTLPVDYLKAQSNLGHLHFDNERWEEAFDTYSEALAAGEDMLALAYTEEGRRVEVAQTSHLYMRAAFCLVQTGQVADALIQLETGKTRLLTEALALSSVFVDSLPAAQRQTLGELQQTIRTLEAESRSVSDDTGHRHRPEHSVQLRDARTKLNNLIASIRAENPDFPPTGMTLHDILALAVPGEALVMPLFTSQGSAAFVVPHGTRTLTEEHLVRFSGFTDDHLRALLAGNKEQPGWLREYATFNATRDLRAWRLALERFTGRLWESILSQVHKRLQTLGAQRVIFMPQGGLGLLPLHAAWRLENGVRRYFIDEYIVRFAPSANALDAAQRHLALREGQRSALILGVSAYEHLNDLPNARPEAEAIADLFDTSPLVDEQATLQAVLNSAPGTAYLHLASHGAFAWGNALNSALVLAGHEKLTLADIIRKLDLDAARLVTLSACETGITDVQQSPDEYVGFPAGFMQAGAPGVVSSLWTVEDRSTALLMERFYRHHLEDNLPPAEALRAAQLWLRDLTRAELGDYYQSFYRISADQAKAEFAKVMLGGAPDDRPYASPYYWAAFTFNGV